MSWKSDRSPTENNHAKNLLYSCHHKAAAIVYLILEANGASPQALEELTTLQAAANTTLLSILHYSDDAERESSREEKGGETYSRFSRFFLPIFLPGELGTTNNATLGFLLLVVLLNGVGS